MARTLVGSLLALAVCAGGLVWAQGRKVGGGQGGTPLEKTDSRVDRSLTGHVEKVEARDEHHGSLAVRSSGAPARGAPGRGTGTGKAPEAAYDYLFQVDAKTRLLTAEGKALEGGLKSRRLPWAEVRVVFVDERRGEPRPGRPHEHFARAVQLISPGKPGAGK